MANIRLPSGVKPVHYDIHIDPDFERKTFEGNVTIALEITETVVSIKLNVFGLVIQDTTLQDSSRNPLQISSTKIDRDSQTFKIVLEHHVPPNTKLFLHQTFTGFIRSDGLGLHMPLDGTCMASTNMEPTSARTVFPCFDSPNLKATFSITLTVPRQFTCVSNMPIASSTDIETKPISKKTVIFEETPVMSTYLIAFAIGRFDFIDTTDFRVPIRAYVPPPYLIDHCKFALDVAGRSLDILERMLAVDYALPKLDLVLVPGSVGGMENWGMLTLSIEAMILAPDNPAADTLSLMQTIAHEMAHQWFGNLVTMSNWEGCWLKEGLAEWAELEVRGRMMENLEPFQDFIADGLQTAFSSDSKRFGHALEISSGGDAVSKSFFDEITYKKGCAVLRMLAAYLGDGVFLEGLRLYLKLHAFGNAVTEDLWNTMSRVSGIDVGAFMKPWTTNPGHPVITVEEDPRRGCIKVTQTPYQYFNSSQPDNPDRLWPIPLQIPNPKGVMTDILRTKTRTIIIPEIFNLNEGQSGFYRIAYNPLRLRRICEDIPNGHLCIEDRIGLISDTFTRAMSGNSNIRMSTLLDLLQNFETEESYFVWKVLISVLNELKACLLFEKKLLASFDLFYKHMVRTCLYRAGTVSPDDDLNEHRFNALMFGNSGGDEKVYAAAVVMFDMFVAGDRTLSPNLRAEVFKIVLTKGGKKEYQNLEKCLAGATLAERTDILRTLGYSQSPKCISKTIKRATNLESISKSETSVILQSLSTHKKGLAALWKFMTSGAWMQTPELSVEKMAPVGGFVLNAFTTMERCENARKFLGTMDTKEFGASLEQVFDGIEVRARWLERGREDLTDWLQRNGYGELRSGGSRGSEMNRNPVMRKWNELWKSKVK